MKQAAQKIGAFLLTMVVASLLTFSAFSLIQGDVATQMLGTSATPERVEALREELGLNGSLPLRYGKWLAAFLRGDMGSSYSYSQSVSSLVGEKLPNTLALTALAFLLIVTVSLPLGLLSVRYREGLWDKVFTVLNQTVMAVPPFFTGILFSWLFGLVLHWFVPGRFVSLSQNPAAYWSYLFFPALALALPRIAMAVRMLRATVLEQLRRDYVRTAVSRGNHSGDVLRRHVLKNSLPPLVTFLAQTMAEILAGSIVVEQVFSIQGLGRLLLNSISNRDFPVVQAIVVLLAFWVVLVNLLADLLNRRIDPRLRLGGEE